MILRALLRVALNGLALFVASTLVPGVSWNGGLLALLLAGFVIGLVNVLVRPLLTLLSLPLILLTLGLFYLVLNGLLLWLASLLLPPLEIAGCLPAILGGLVIAIFNWATSWATERPRR